MHHSKIYRIHLCEYVSQEHTGKIYNIQTLIWIIKKLSIHDFHLIVKINETMNLHEAYITTTYYLYILMKGPNNGITKA